MEFGRSKKKMASRSLAPTGVGRLRIRWGRKDSQRLLSHLDNMRAIEQAIRDSGIPVTYSQAAHPRMKLSFSPPLPMGFTSEAEFVDISLDQICTSSMINSIRKSMPDGFELLETKTVFAKTASLSESINRAIYTLKLDDHADIAKLKEQAAALLIKNKIEIMRKTKSGETPVDIRPLIFEIKINQCELQLTLGTGQSGYARPTEVAQLLLGIDELQAATLQFHRKEMYRQTEDSRYIPAIEL